ncbi:MAG: helix-turn-helix domain-containing protein [Bacteroidota bacterium]
MTKKVKTKPKEVYALAKRIKQLRLKKGYKSYEIFAYDHNISRSQYGRYEKGEDIRYTSLLKVIRALGVTPKEFFSKDFDDL